MVNASSECGLERFVSFKDLKEFMGLSRNTIMLAIKEGKFPNPIRLGGRVLFRLCDVQKFLAIQLNENQSIV